MALTRAQLLMGNQNQGAVLPGQVQGVKTIPGSGLTISIDGTISFDPTNNTDVVLTNNSEAFNDYIWPNSLGLDATFLSTNSSGSLSWQAPNIGSVVSVGLQPSPAKVGRLWFDQGTRTLKIYENVSSIGQWTPVSQGLPVTPGQVTSNPGFISGNGTIDDAFLTSDISLVSGSFAKTANVITVSNLAPYQYVPIIDVYGPQNGYRFFPTSYFADGDGNLTFSIAYQDYPSTPSGQSRVAKFKVGFSECYISADAVISESLSIVTPGAISGTAEVGQSLTYTTGVATGGIPPYTYTWAWKKQSDDSVIQTNGNLLTIPASLVNNRVFITLTVQDSALNTVSASTASYPLSPDLIGKGTFPNTVIAFPTTTLEEASTLWIDEDTDLLASGCIQFKVDAGPYSQGLTSINNGQTITTRWISSSVCGNAPTATTISGCVYDDKYQECGSLTIDRIPNPFTFLPVSGIVPGNIGTSNAIVPMGINARAYVSYTGTSTATLIEASINGGSFAALPTYGSNTFPIDPGQSLQIRATTGSSPSSAYNANINIGEGTIVQSATFTLNTSAAANFVTPIDFPVITTADSSAVTWLAGDGSTTLTSTGCIEFKVNAGSFGQGPTAITTGDTITTRWNSGLSCGGAAHGTTITGTVTNGVSTNYASLTIDRVPATFTFTNLTNQSTSTLVTSNVLNISGFNAPAYITRSAPPSGSSLTTVEASVAGGPWTAIPTSGTTLSIDPVASGPGNTLQIRGITGGSTSTAYGVQVNAGESTSIQTSVWTATTAAVVPGIVTPSILTPVNGSTNLNPYSVTPPGITITSSPYTPINGAGTHASTDWEIRKNSISGTVVFFGNSVTELVSYFLSVSSIDPNSAYFVRCRYYSNDLVPVISSWSPWSQFNTAVTFNLVWATRVTSGSAEIYWNAVTWVGGTTNKFVAVGDYGYPTKISSNGISWSDGGIIPGSRPMLAVTSFNDLIVAVGTSGECRTSNNGGTTWTVTPDVDGGDSVMYTIACNPSGRFVAAGEDGKIRTTLNPSGGWTAVVGSSGGGEITSIVWDSLNSRFIGARYNKTIYTSADGLTWTVSSVPSIPFYFGQIIVVPGSTQRYILLPYFDGLNGTASQYAASQDLVSWSVYSTPKVVNAGAVGGNFVALGGYTGGGASNDQIISGPINPSPSGNLPATFNSTFVTPSDGGVWWYAMTYSPTLNRFVAVGDDRKIYSTS